MTEFEVRRIVRSEQNSGAPVLFVVGLMCLWLIANVLSTTIPKHRADQSGRQFLCWSDARPSADPDIYWFALVRDKVEERCVEVDHIREAAK